MTRATTMTLVYISILTYGINELDYECFKVRSWWIIMMQNVRFIWIKGFLPVEGFDLLLPPNWWKFMIDELISLTFKYRFHFINEITYSYVKDTSACTTDCTWDKVVVIILSTFIRFVVVVIAAIIILVSCSISCVSTCIF